MGCVFKTQRDLRHTYQSVTLTSTGQLRHAVLKIRLGEGCLLIGDDRLIKARALATGATAQAFAQLMDVVGQDIALNQEGGRKATEQAEKDYHLALYLLGGLAALAVALGTVLAWAITSLPCKASGRLAAWIAVICV